MPNEIDRQGRYEHLQFTDGSPCWGSPEIMAENPPLAVAGSKENARLWRPPKQRCHLFRSQRRWLPDKATRTRTVSIKKSPVLCTIPSPYILDQHPLGPWLHPKKHLHHQHPGISIISITMKNRQHQSNPILNAVWKPTSFNTINPYHHQVQPTSFKPPVSITSFNQHDHINQ